VEGIALGHKALDQCLELGLTLGAITRFRVQGVCYFLDFLGDSSLISTRNEVTASRFGLES